MQLTTGCIQFLLYILIWVVGKTICLEQTHINWYRHKEDVGKAVMVWLNTIFICIEHAYVANWLSYERCSCPLNETFIWYSWVISYIHLCGLKISIKASRRYHGNHQEKSMSIDAAPCEAFNLMHTLELPIDGHIKLNKELFMWDI